MVSFSSGRQTAVDCVFIVGTDTSPGRPNRENPDFEISKNVENIAKNKFLSKKMFFSWEAFGSRYFVCRTVWGFLSAGDALTSSILLFFERQEHQNHWFPLVFCPFWTWKNKEISWKSRCLRVPNTSTPKKYAANDVSPPESFPGTKIVFFRKMIFRNIFGIFRNLKTHENQWNSMKIYEIEPTMCSEWPIIVIR